MPQKALLSFCHLCICIGLLFSCNHKEAAQQSGVEDTRILVKEALDSVHVMTVSANFNSQRLAIIKSQLDQEKDPTKQLNLNFQYAAELAKCGRNKESLKQYKLITDYIVKNNVEIDQNNVRNLLSLIGVTFMRLGEIDNCVQNHNHSSCIIPIKGEGVHQQTYGSENAITQFTKALEIFPDDLETRYLLNLAYMTLGQYPDKVPEKWRIDPSWFKNKVSIQPFKDIAPQLGVNRNGLAGGVVLEDLENDGWLDIIITSWSPKEELIAYKNNGNGTFTDQTEAYGLKGQVCILNLNQTDFNNDGWVDLLLMRGAWFQTEGDIPCTLMMNDGKGKFIDVTQKAGITHVAARQDGAWADFNLDGWVDLVMGNESQTNYERGIDLYINQKDGTFKHESIQYGLTLNQFFKGVVATDVNDDRYPDIYFSSLQNENSLFINQGFKGQNAFALAPPEVNVGAPLRSFPCWSFDYDNDGKEDIFVSSYTNDGTPSQYWMLSHMGKADPAMFPKLYHNKGNMQFEETGQQMGLNEVAYTMGCNFGDINTDGYLDFYLATGNPLFQSLVPNKMYLNVEGKKFEDVSYSGFSNVQKGHGVGFGDLDHDGDEDIYVVIGGAVEGDAFFNNLFENPNEHQNNWVVLKLEGTTANRFAIGARVCVTITEAGKERKIYRTVTSGASFGGNSMILEVGLRKASAIKDVAVQWPCKDCPDQKFTGLEINKAYNLKQGESSPKEMVYNAISFDAGGSMKEHHMHQ